MMSDDDSDERDARGRWRKGFCPNPKGRPRKEPKISDADIGWFKQSIVEATINGERRQLTRHELLIHAMFEQAIKGKNAVLARKLFDRFEEVEMTWAQGRELLRDKREKFLEEYYERGTFDEKAATEILDLHEMLTYGRKPKPQRKPRLKALSGAASWRKGPKPQSLIDLEKAVAEEEAALRVAYEARCKPAEEPDGPAD